MTNPSLGFIGGGRIARILLQGAVQTYFQSGLPPEAVLDLIPSRPLGEAEESFKEAFRSKLEPLFLKLKT